MIRIDEYKPRVLMWIVVEPILLSETKVMNVKCCSAVQVLEGVWMIDTVG